MMDRAGEAPKTFDVVYGVSKRPFFKRIVRPAFDLVVVMIEDPHRCSNNRVM